MVGFNRRFAPFTEKIRQFFAGRTEPMLLHARINAGYIPLDHWIHADGGRIVGEFCHFVDWARSVIGFPVQAVSAVALPDGARYNSDNIAVTLKFTDGSLANLLYLANGDRGVPKEFFEVFCQGGIARLDDFKTLDLSRNGKLQTIKSAQDKGHRRELELTIDAVRSGKPSPIAFEELVEVTETTFLVQQALTVGAALPFAHSTVAEAPRSEPVDMPHPLTVPATDAGNSVCA